MILELLLNQVEDTVIRDNFRKIVEFINGQVPGGKSFQAVELFVTANATSIKINHSLGSVPKDAILTMLVASSTARLVIDYAEFTDSQVSFDVSGLASGEKLHARLLIGTFQDVVTVGESFAEEDATQQVRSKF